MFRFVSVFLSIVLAGLVRLWIVVAARPGCAACVFVLVFPVAFYFIFIFCCAPPRSYQFTVLHVIFEQ